MERTVSAYDQEVLKKIRQNVDLFLQRQARLLDRPDLHVLDIAPQIHKGASAHFIQASVVTADIDPQSGADYILDICQNNADQLADESFHVVVCTEVLEHTLNPFGAVAEMYRLLKPGGVLLLTTPFDFRIHGPLPDCWRFTEHGLRVLLKQFEIDELEGLENAQRFLMPFHYTVVARKP